MHSYAVVTWYENDCNQPPIVTTGSIKAKNDLDAVKQVAQETDADMIFVRKHC